jgi:O-antigen ligase
MNIDLQASTDRRQLVAGAVAFSIPALVLVSETGIGLVSFAFLAAVLFDPRGARGAFLRHLHATRWVVLAFSLNFMFALLCFLLRPEAGLSTLEKPLRMLLALAAMLVVQTARPPSSTLWHGVIAGALAGAAFAGYQRWGLGLDRPGGFINPITFGDISMSLALLALAWAGTVRPGRQVLWPCLGALAGLVGSIATGTRGAWLALVCSAILFVCYRQRIHGRLIRVLALLGLSIVVAGYFVPQTGMRARIAAAAADFDAYFSGGSAFTQVGIRLELWKGAIMLIAERPLLGRDLGAAKASMGAMVAEGRLDPVALPPSHFHQDILQNLVTGGVLGLLVWAGTLVAPFMFFANQFGAREHPGRERMALALAGMLFIGGYFSFGLTEVIFWSVRGCMFYALMVFVLMGFCLNGRDEEQAAPGRDEANLDQGEPSHAERPVA